MNAEQFKTLFLPLHRQLYQTAYRLLQNREDAEDIVQEAYLKLWDMREELVIQTNTASFCNTLVKRLCIDLWRKRNSQSETSIESTLQICSEHNTEQEVEYHDDSYHLKQLISHLPKQQQQVIWLRDIGAYSFEEIAKATGMNAVNIRSALSRARKKIKEQIKQMYQI